MDWTAAIEKNREALRRVLAGLLVMAGFAGVAGAGRPATLPRHLHRAVLALLRPAEAAVRRLVIVAARGLQNALPPLRPRGPRGKRRPARAAPGFRLFDPLPRPGRPRPPAPAFRPRISFPGFAGLPPLPPPPMPFDAIDAAPLARRLAVLAAVLDDLPKQARRFARWQARVRLAAGEGLVPAARCRDTHGREAPEAGRSGRSAPAGRAGAGRRICRAWPLRPGRPPGQRPPRARRPAHAVHDILTGTHGLALWSLEPADTS